MNTTTLERTSSRQVTSWEIDPDHTEVGFEIKHLMIARVRGRFGTVKGTIVMDEAEPTRSSVEVEIDAASIDTRQSQRDDHLRSPDFFDVARFPELRFRGTVLRRTPAGFDLAGELTVRDVTREVVLEVVEEGRGSDPWGGERVAYSATTSIDRRDFGLTWNQALETGGVLVGNEVRISIDLQAVNTG